MTVGFRDAKFDVLIVKRLEFEQQTKRSLVSVNTIFDKKMKQLTVEHWKFLVSQRKSG